MTFYRQKDTKKILIHLISTFPFSQIYLYMELLLIDGKMLFANYMNF